MGEYEEEEKAEVKVYKEEIREYQAERDEYMWQGMQGLGAASLKLPSYPVDFLSFPSLSVSSISPSCPRRHGTLRSPIDIQYYSRRRSVCLAHKSCPDGLHADQHCLTLFLVQLASSPV